MLSVDEEAIRVGVDFSQLLTAKVVGFLASSSWESKNPLIVILKASKKAQFFIFVLM